MTFLLWVAPTPRLWAGSSFHPHGSFPPVEHLGLLLEAPVWASLMDGLRSPTKKAPSLPPSLSASSFSALVHVCPFRLRFKTRQQRKRSFKGNLLFYCIPEVCADHNSEDNALFVLIKNLCESAHDIQSEEPASQPGGRRRAGPERVRTVVSRLQLQVHLDTSGLTNDLQSPLHVLV